MSEVSAFALPAGTVTFLLTDIEGSTRLWESASEAMPAAVARHYEILDEAIARHAGVRPVEQGEGDSVVAAFTRATDALAAALDAQRGLVAEEWPDGAELRVRIALHTGDARLRDEGNYFGAAVNRCARLRAIAHGGQVLLSGATADLVADGLPDGAQLLDLGVHRLRDLGRPERVFALAHSDLPGEQRPLRSLDELANNLPAQLTSFVGRRRELAELREALTSTRILTLTGAGGCGKTRLGLQLAADALDSYPDGVWCVELAPLSDANLAVSALATAIGVRPLPGQTPLDAVVLRLASARALVLLDNCEHLLEPSADLAEGLLRGCPDVAVVATSREPLGVEGETTWRVPSLSVPPEGTPEALEALEQSDAVRLFIERAVKVRPNFTVTNENAPYVAQICQELDGIPLAIELAAARVRVLSVEQLAAGLADRFRLLTGGARTALPRQQTLRASVDWSHELLDEYERALLRRLGVFKGGFTLDAAEAVCAGEGLEHYAILDLLTSLVDQSLVLVEERGALSRYRLLETVRHYALDRLSEAGETERLRDRHADFFVALAERAEPELTVDERWLEVLDADAANLYAAIDHTAQTQPENALRLCAALTYWWVLRALLVEGTAALTLALDATAGRRSEARGRALFGRGYLAFFAGDYELTERVATEALELTQELGDQATEARVLDLIAASTFMWDPRAALPTLEQSRELARVAGDDWCLAEATQNLGWVLVTMGEHEAGRAKLEAAFELAREHGFRDLVAWHGFMLGHAVRPAADNEACRASWERAVEESSEIQEGVATWGLGMLDIERGEPGAALERLETCRARMVTAGVGLALAFLELGIAVAKASLGRVEEARRELAAIAERDADGVAWPLTQTLSYLAHVERLTGDEAASQAAAERALAVAEHLGNRWLIARARHQLGRLAAARADWASADALLHEALGAQAEHAYWLDLPDSLDALADVAAGLESHAEAARLLAAAKRARSELGIVRWMPEHDHWEALEDRLRDELGAEAFAAAWAEGEALTRDEAVAYVRRARGARKRPPGGWESLTPTELEVVRHAAAGLTNPEIGERMFISRGTVKVHLSHIYAKLGIRNRSELAAEVSRRQIPTGSDAKTPAA